MACPVQCSCGRNLAELHECFHALLVAHINRSMEKSSVHPLMQGVSEGEVPGIRYIFDFLELDSACCRNKIKNFRDSESKLFGYLNAHKKYDEEFKWRE